MDACRLLVKLLFDHDFTFRIMAVQLSLATLEDFLDQYEAFLIMDTELKEKSNGCQLVILLIIEP
ncbi:hypothetical protein EYZ11_007624 [Aspergillus tanneri]|uniref:Uncharacterized protein n=1 Tax=Aspergillus tanneri TaxID=1220188 RepID=A0A4S3JCR2_9EURO|nr:hypothetical protein EYZ11_007624 [Aspergillus tanneri]